MKDFDTKSRLATSRRKLLEARLSGIRKEAKDGTDEGSGENCKYFPLAPNQQGIWIEEQIVSDSTAFNIAYSFEINGVLDKRILGNCFREVIARHGALRTRLDMTQNGVSQYIAEQNNFLMQELDFSSISLKERKAILDAKIENLASYKFDLRNEFPYKITLIELASTRFVLIIVIHHIAFDGWSAEILFREISTLYSNHKSSKRVELTPLSMSYKKYVDNRLSYLDSFAFEQSLDYWKNNLGDVPPVSSLPIYKRSSKGQFNEDGRVRFKLSRTTTIQLERFIKQNGMTHSIVLSTIFAILLKRYSNAPSILITIPTSGRFELAAENVIGCFASILPMKFGFCNDYTFIEALEESKKCFSPKF